MYKLKSINRNKKTKITLLGSGAILREMIEASEILDKDYKIDSEIWSVTSYNELRRDGLEVERQNLLNPNQEPKKTYVEKCLKDSEGPILAASRVFIPLVQMGTEEVIQEKILETFSKLIKNILLHTL